MLQDINDIYIATRYIELLCKGTSKKPIFQGNEDVLVQIKATRHG